MWQKEIVKSSVMSSKRSLSVIIMVAYPIIFITNAVDNVINASCKFFFYPRIPVTYIDATISVAVVGVCIALFLLLHKYQKKPFLLTMIVVMALVSGPYILENNLRHTDLIKSILRHEF